MVFKLEKVGRTVLEDYRGSVSGGVADGEPEGPVRPESGGGERDAEGGPVIGERLEVV